MKIYLTHQDADLIRRDQSMRVVSARGHADRQLGGSADGGGQHLRSEPMKLADRHHGKIKSDGRAV
jgi:hypothetical protein